MKPNVGSTDRVIRIILALALFSLAFVLEDNWRLLALIGLVPLVTAVMRWCPAYWMFEASTCKDEEQAPAGQH